MFTEKKLKNLQEQINAVKQELQEHKIVALEEHHNKLEVGNLVYFLKPEPHYLDMKRHVYFNVYVVAHAEVISIDEGEQKVVLRYHSNDFVEKSTSEVWTNVSTAFTFSTNMTMGELMKCIDVLYQKLDRLEEAKDERVSKN